MQISPEIWGGAFLGLMIALKGFVDFLWRRKHGGNCIEQEYLDMIKKTYDARHTEEEKNRLRDLWKMHCEAQAIDPIDGLPRWYGRDIDRKILAGVEELLRDKRRGISNNSR